LHRTLLRETCKHAGMSDASDASTLDAPWRPTLTTTEARSHAQTLTSHSVRCGNSVGATSDAHPSDSLMHGFHSHRKLRIHQTLGQRPTPPRPASGNTPATSLNFPRRNRKYALHFLKSAESRGRKKPKSPCFGSCLWPACCMLNFNRMHADLDTQIAN